MTPVMSNTKHSRNLGCALKIMVITNYLISTIWRMAVDFFSLRHMKQQSRKLINIIRAIKMLTLLRNSKMKRAWVSSCPYISIHLKGYQYRQHSFTCPTSSYAQKLWITGRRIISTKTSVSTAYYSVLCINYHATHACYGVN